MKTSISILATFLFLSISFQSSSQTAVAEKNISFSILKWFYNDYPNADQRTWKEEVEDGEKRYYVSFKFEDSKYETIYDTDGKRVEEIHYVETPPIDLTNTLYNTFDNFKIKEVAKKTKFSTKEEAFIVTLKIKGEGEKELVFDDNTVSLKNQALSKN